MKTLIAILLLIPHLALADNVIFFGYAGERCDSMISLNEDKTKQKQIEEYIKAFISGMNLANYQSINSTIENLYESSMQYCEDNPDHLFAIALGKTYVSSETKSLENL